MKKSKSVYLPCSLATPTMLTLIYILSNLVLLIILVLLTFVIIKIVYNKVRQQPIWDNSIRNITITLVIMFLYFVIYALSYDIEGWFNQFSMYYYLYWILTISVFAVLLATQKTIHKGWKIFLLALIIILAIVSIIVTIGVNIESKKEPIQNQNSDYEFGTGGCGSSSFF